MKKILSLILCAMMVLSIFSGCAAEDRPYVPKGSQLLPEDTDVNIPIKEEKEPQELTMVCYMNRSMNPYVSNDFTNRMLLSLIYQGLFATSSDFDAVPILCEKYRVSSDYKIYTFYLADATFSDGTPVTIEDVSASFDAAIDSKYYGNRFYQVIKTVINEDRSITFYLRTPMEDFPKLLDFPILKAEELEAEHPLGTGPYIFESNLAGAQLRRNGAWWCSSPDLAVTA